MVKPKVIKQAFACQLPIDCVEYIDAIYRSCDKSKNQIIEEIVRSHMMQQRVSA